MAIWSCRDYWRREYSKRPCSAAVTVNRSLASDFEGRNVLVVGGSGAIGAEACRMFVERGANLFLTYSRSPESALAMAEHLPRARVLGIEQLDISDSQGVERLVSVAWERLAGIDAVVNTAGYLHRLQPFVDVDFSEIHDTVNVELFGVINLVKAIVPSMIETGYGRIVIVASDSGKVGAKGGAASAAARGGVIAFSKSIAREVASLDICINVVCPGPTEGSLLDSLTIADDMSGRQMSGMIRATPKKRAAKPSEVAETVLFLASERASFITGQAISVSGGLTMM
jgi:2-hydroxycyclohexanecarboxyl-CoA dehydrogenase